MKNKVNSSAHDWHCVMGVPLAPLQASSAQKASTIPPRKITDLNQSVFAQTLRYWRQQEEIDTPYKATQLWLDQLDKQSIGASADEERSFEALHKLWQRAERGTRNQKRHVDDLMRFTQLDESIHPLRGQSSDNLVKRHGLNIEGHFALTTDGTLPTNDLRPGYFTQSGPLLPALIMDLLALDTELRESCRKPNKPMRATAQNMAVELVILLMSQGLMLHRAAYEHALQPHLFDLGAQTEWPLTVVEHLISQQHESQISPWMALLAFGASLSLALRDETRRTLLPGLGMSSRKEERVHLWLHGLLAPLHLPLHHVYPMDEGLRHIHLQAQAARPALRQACQWLGIANLPDLAYQQLSLSLLPPMTQPHSLPNAHALRNRSVMAPANGARG